MVPFEQKNGPKKFICLIKCFEDKKMKTLNTFYNPRNSNISREASEFTGWGVAANGNPYNSRESPYLRLIFTQHTIWPLSPKIFDGPISFVPPNGASNFVRPPNDASTIFRPPPGPKTYIQGHSL